MDTAFTELAFEEARFLFALFCSSPARARFWPRLFFHTRAGKSEAAQRTAPLSCGCFVVVFCVCGAARAPCACVRATTPSTQQQQHATQ